MKIKIASSVFLCRKKSQAGGKIGLGRSRWEPGRIGGGKPERKRKGGGEVLHLAYLETCEPTKKQKFTPALG